MLQIYDHPGGRLSRLSRLSRQSGINFEVRDGGSVQHLISLKGQWLGGSQAEVDRGGFRPEVDIKVWYEKQERSLLDTAASNLRLTVGEDLVEQGIQLHCTATIGQI